MSEKPLFFLPFGSQVIALTAEELQAGLARGRELFGVTATPPGANGDAPEYLCTAEEMEERTKVPASWFLEQARLGRVPHIKLGKYTRFRLSEIVAHGAVTPPGEGAVDKQWTRRQNGKRAAGGAP